MQNEHQRPYSVVDMDAWARKSIFDFFGSYADPFFNFTATVDVDVLYRICKARGLSVSLALLHCSLAAANDIREFRIRLLDGRLVEFDRIHATQTILNADDTFSFAYFEYTDDLVDFERSGRQALEKYKVMKTFDVEADRVDLIYYSVIPWVSFTSFKHASRLDRSLTIPKIVFGKIFDSAEGKRVPVSVEANHMIMDGVHVGRFFFRLEERLKGMPDEPLVSQGPAGT